MRAQGRASCGRSSRHPVPLLFAFPGAEVDRRDGRRLSDGSHMVRVADAIGGEDVDGGEEGGEALVGGIVGVLVQVSAFGERRGCRAQQRRRRARGRCS